MFYLSVCHVRGLGKFKINWFKKNVKATEWWFFPFSFGVLFLRLFPSLRVIKFRFFFHLKKFPWNSAEMIVRCNETKMLENALPTFDFSSKTLNHLESKKHVRITVAHDCHNVSKSLCSHQRCSIKECVLKNFVNFAGMHLCRSLFFNKVSVSALQFY